MKKTDNPKECQQCGHETNKLYNKTYNGTALIECYTRCERCNFSDLWVLGKFESSYKQSA